jgi:hypothetical protein
MASYIRNRLRGKTTIVLYFGDFDPSGVDIERDLTKRLEKYDAGDFRVERIALTKDQIVTYDLPPIPVKKSDVRTPGFVSSFGDKAVELDALDPNVLKLLVSRAISSHIELDLWRKKEEQIEDLREWIRKKLNNMENLLT